MPALVPDTQQAPRRDLEAEAIERLLFYVPILAGLALPLCLFLLPQPDGVHVGAALVVAGLSIIVGVVFRTGLFPVRRVSPEALAVTLTVLLGIVAAGLWATGGVDSYVRDIYVVALLFAAYFFPTRRLVLLMTTAVVIAVATPLLYVSSEQAGRYVSVLIFTALSCYSVALVITRLKNQLEAAERSQREIASQDPLTDVANRRAFDAALEREVSLLPGVPTERALQTAVLFVDLDRFKQVNDRYGHPVGDQVLRAVAEATEGAVRPGDLVARIGGDEFAIVAPRAGRAGAEEIAGRIVAAVKRVRPMPGAEPVGATVAFSLLGDDGADAESVMNIVDHRLHKQKRGAGIRDDDDEESFPSFSGT